jgi:hypothetical protein
MRNDQTEATTADETHENAAHTHTHINKHKTKKKKLVIVNNSSN